MNDLLRLRLGLPGRALYICAIAQLAELLLFDLGADAAGHALQVSPVNALMLQLPLYAVGLIVPMAAWSALQWRLPRLRRTWDIAGGLVAGVLMLLCVLDLGMQRFRGERLSLSHLATYATSDLMSSDWIAPVLETWRPSVIMLVILAGAWLALLISHRAGSTDERPGHSTAALAIMAALLWIPPRFAYYHQRDMARSPQSVLLEQVIFPSPTPDAATETAERADLRAFLERDGARRWLSDSFPVWHIAPRSASPGFGKAALDPPDIVLFEIESLRGRDVGWGFGGRRGADSPTPHLDSLAAQAVVFPHYIANGEPSPRGFITLQSGSWEHGNLFIVANRASVTLDALPLRLRARGYHNIALWGGNPSFDNQLVWGRRWYDDIDFEQRGNRVFYFHTTPDRDLMSRVIARVDAHDSAHARQPFFMFVATAGTHTPFTLEDSAAVTPDVPPSSDRQRRYDLALRNADAQIARVIARLRSRPRWKNTVVIVTGDHADQTTEPVLPQQRGMPTDAHVATAALVFGPESLVGRPRVLDFPASHVDVLPTIASWLGDTTATATVGRDLFDTTRVASRQAVAINSRGYRLDRGGFTLMVDAREPAVFSAWRSFTGEQPALLPLSSTAFAPDEPARLHAMIRYWSSLIDRNRVRP